MQDDIRKIRTLKVRINRRILYNIIMKDIAEHSGIYYGYVMAAINKAVKENKKWLIIK